MSQQEFEPGSQSKPDSLNEDDEIQYPQYPYSWSGKPHQEGVPRDEPPFSYDTTMMQQRDKAQSSAGNQNPTGSSQPKVEGRYEYIAPEGDGDAYEQGYRPNNSYNATQSGQSVPPWARPQRHRRAPMRFGFIILILIGVGLLNAIFAHAGPMIGFGDIFGTIIGILLFVIVVPLIVLFVLLSIIFRMLRPRRFRYWRRGPWWF